MVGEVILLAGFHGSGLETAEPYVGAIEAAGVSAHGGPISYASLVGSEQTFNPGTVRISNYPPGLVGVDTCSITLTELSISKRAIREGLKSVAQNFLLDEILGKVPGPQFGLGRYDTPSDQGLYFFLGGEAGHLEGAVGFGISLAPIFGP